MRKRILLFILPFVVTFGEIMLVRLKPCSTLFAQEQSVGELVEKAKEAGLIKEKEETEKEEGEKKVPPKKGGAYGAPEAPSTIEQMFRETFPLEVSRRISQFGYDIFGALPSVFAPPEMMPVPSEYILGPGDELIINVWGKVQETFSLKIDRDGKIVLPKAGVLSIWGTKFEDAESLIKNKLSQYYENLECNVSMGRLRSIKVFVLGELRQPGSYTISSLSTPFHALCAAGGPTKLGSLRDIKLVRTNQMIDLYDLLVYGKKNEEDILNSGDILYVPLIGKVVGIAGCVKRPAIYELREGENLKELLDMAGGVTPIGYIKRIQIERIEHHKRRIVQDLEFKDFEKEVKGFRLENGDLVFISPILPERRNYVSILGNIKRPGNYEIKPGSRVKDLVEEAEGLLPGTYLKRAEISRYVAEKQREIIPLNLGEALTGDYAQNIELKEWDILTVYAETDVLPKFYVTIEGAVFKPGKYKLTPNMELRDLIFRGGGFLSTADIMHSELYKMRPETSPEIIPLNLADSTHLELQLEPNDYLFVRENIEWAALPSITITGEVIRPGKYIASKDEKLSSIIKRAGGFTEEAFLKGASLVRESVKEMQNKAIRDFIDNARKELYLEMSKLEARSLPEEEKTRSRKIIKYRESLIDQLSKVEIPGRIIIDLEKIDNPENDIVVMDGDLLHVPKTPNTVQIIGCVCNPSAIVYQKGKSIDWYISKVGGVTEEGSRKNTYVLKGSGEVIRSGEIEPGDCIIVPQKFEISTPLSTLVKDVAQVLFHLGYTAAIVHTFLPK